MPRFDRGDVVGRVSLPRFPVPCDRQSTLAKVEENCLAIAVHADILPSTSARDSATPFALSGGQLFYSVEKGSQ